MENKLHLTLRLAILISGGGTTMQAIIKACKSGRLKNIDPVLVIASRVEAKGIQKAESEGVLCKILSPKDYPDPLQFGEVILRECRLSNVDLISQNGWLVKTPANVIAAYENMMINQHPGPLDPGQSDFGGQGMYGMRVHAAVIYFSRKINHQFLTEATVQRVAKNYDQGQVLRRISLPILETDDPLTLQQKLLPLEHQAVIEALDDFANNRVTELKREKPLINPWEIPILDEAKKTAALLFPRG